MTKQVLMSSGTEEGLVECLKAYWPGQKPALLGSEWPKRVSNGVYTVEGLEAVKKGKKQVRYQIVRAEG